MSYSFHFENFKLKSNQKNTFHQNPIVLFLGKAYIGYLGSAENKDKLGHFNQRFHMKLKLGFNLSA